ncbi:MAG TPA: hypothetical protein VFM23_10350 [Gemmatimonadales bacterium]|nr:hypothetical protein [Gemmatimonadales bacterium]
MRAFPAEQSAARDRLAIHDLGPRRGARDRELAPHQIPARRGRASPKRVVAEHPLERASPRGGIERRDE